MTKSVIIIGAGGHGRVVLDACRSSGRIVEGFLDSVHHAGTTVNGCIVLGDNKLISDAEWLARHDFVVAIGDQNTRQSISLQLLGAGATLATIIHPSCIVSDSATIDAGSVLVAGAIVNSNARIGKYCIINTSATIDHDVVLADGVQICPGANLAGGVQCGELVFVGTGAIIVPRVTIGNHAVIGAGAVVLEPVPAQMLAAGNPAQIKRPA